MDNFKNSFFEEDQNNLYMKVNYIKEEKKDNTFQDIFSNQKIENTLFELNKNDKKEKIDDKNSLKITKCNKIFFKNKIKKIDFEIDSDNIKDKIIINTDNSCTNKSKEISQKQKNFEGLSEYQKNNIYKLIKMHKDTEKDDIIFSEFNYNYFENENNLKEKFNNHPKENIKMKKIHNITYNRNKLNNNKINNENLNEDSINKMSLNYLNDVKRLEFLFENKNIKDDLSIDKICCICDNFLIDNISIFSQNEINNDKKNKIFRLNCGHCFHKFCFIQWFKYKKICPLCRLDVNINFDFPIEKNSLIYFEDKK
jgi:hypothetical protein